MGQQWCNENCCPPRNLYPAHPGANRGRVALAVPGALQQPLKPIENQIEAELEGRVFIVGLVGVLHRNRGE